MTYPCTHVKKDGTLCTRKAKKDEGASTRCNQHRNIDPHIRCAEDGCTVFRQAHNKHGYCGKHAKQHGLYAQPWAVETKSQPAVPQVVPAAPPKTWGRVIDVNDIDAFIASQ